MYFIILIVYLVLSFLLVSSNGSLVMTLMQLYFLGLLRELCYGRIKNIVLIFIAYDVAGIGWLFFLALANAAVSVFVYIFGASGEDDE